MRPYSFVFMMSMLLHLFTIATRLAMPYISKIIVDDVISKGNYNLLYWCVGALIGLSVLRAISNFFRVRCAEIVGQGVIYDLKIKLFRHLQSLSFSFYDEHRIGEIMSRMTGDIEGVRQFVSVGFVQILEMIVFFVGSMAVLMLLNWRSTLLILAVMPILALLAYLFNKRIAPVFRDMREANADLNTAVQENIAGVRVVKAFAREEYEQEKFSTQNHRVLQSNLDAVTVNAKYLPIMDFLGGLLPVVILLTSGTYFAVNHIGNMTVGTLVAMGAYIWMIAGPLRSISSIVNLLRQALTSSEKLFYYLDLGADIKDKPGATMPRDFHGRVRFEGVSFRYRDQDVLQDISFEVAPGKSLAIMGATGSGKTSIINLIPRFYECYRGQVTIDGIDVKDYPLQPLRSQIGIVMQETFLFSDTLQSNIGFGASSISQSHAEQVAQIAQAEEFIREMPEGYEAMVGERGIGLSGGQKQRIAIARALAIQPKILILDDATSSVDMETEFAIQQGIEQYSKATAMIIIAHRISSVKNADEIIVLSDGRIVERGNHHELVAQKGRYWQMVQDQHEDYGLLMDKGVG